MTRRIAFTANEFAALERAFVESLVSGGGPIDAVLAALPAHIRDVFGALADEGAPLFASTLAERASSFGAVHSLAHGLLATFAADTPLARGYRMRAASEVLKEEAQAAADAEAMALANDEKSAQLVAADAAVRLAELLEVLTNTGVAIPEEGPDPPERNGMLAWDDELAGLLERIGPDGKLGAGIVRQKAAARWARRNPEAPAKLWSLWFSSATGAPPAVRHVMRALWRDAVRPALEQERSKRARNVHVPSLVLGSLAHARGLHVNTRSSDMFVSIVGTDTDVRVVCVEPPKGFALLLPFDAIVRTAAADGTVSLRQVLHGHTLLTYLATWAAWQDSDADATGLFAWNERDVLGSYFRNAMVSDGKGYVRAHPKSLASLRDSVGRLTDIRIREVGDVEAKVPEPLIQLYRDKNGRKPPMYRHAPILLGALRANYTQFPRAILTLDASDAPVAISLARLVRELALGILDRGGTHEDLLTVWLDALGEDTAAGARKEGRAFWPKAADRVARIAEQGSIGKVSVSGEGRETVLRLDVNANLLRAYQPLLEARDRHVRADAKALMTEKVLDRRARRK